MKKKSISDAIGNIDEKYVVEAGEYKAKKRSVAALKKWAFAVAACLVLCLSVPLVISMMNSKTPPPHITPDPVATTDTDVPETTETEVPTETTERTEEPTETKPEPTGDIGDMGANDTGDTTVGGDTGGKQQDGVGGSEIDPNDYILTNGPGCAGGFFYNYLEYDVPENLFINEDTPLADKYPVYISKYPVGHTGPLYENSEENANLAKDNLKNFLCLLYDTDEVESLDMKEWDYGAKNLELPKRYETETEIGTFHAAAERVGVILNTPEVFSGTIEEFIEGNEILEAMMKFAGITDYEILTHSDRYFVYYTLISPTKPLTEMDFFEGATSISFHVYEGKVNGYGLNIKVTDGILGEYETIPYSEALEAVKIAYPDADHENIKAYVYYNIGFYKNEDAPNEPKLSGCLFPCYRFIIPKTDEDGECVIATADIPMTVYDAIMP